MSLSVATRGAIVGHAAVAEQLVVDLARGLEGGHARSRARPRPSPRARRTASRPEIRSFVFAIARLSFRSLSGAAFPAPRAAQTAIYAARAAWRTRAARRRAALGDAAVERGVEHLLDRVGEHELERARAPRPEAPRGRARSRAGARPCCRPGALRGEHLLADAADRQHLAGERDLAGHPDVLRDGPAADERDDRRRHRDARRGPVLRHRAGRHVHVDVVLGEPVRGRGRAARRAPAPTSAPPAPTPASPRRAGRSP